MQIMSFRPLLAATAIAAAITCIAAPSAQAVPMQFGVQSNNTALTGDPLTTEIALDDMSQLGVKILRITLSWNRVASGNCAKQSYRALESDTNACYNWGYLDTLVTKARAHKITVLASIYEVPKYASGRNDIYFMGTSQRQFEKLVKYYAAFAKAAATHYKPGSPNGYIKYWTVLNEPNSATFWKPHNKTVPKRFAYAYSKVARAIRSVGRTFKIAPGPTGPKSTTKPADFIHVTQPWLKRYLAASPGPKSLMNGWAHNPYPKNKLAPRNRTAYANPSIGINNLSVLFRTLDAAPVTRGLPVWATEFSYQTNPPDKRFGISLLNQATYLAEIYDILSTSGRVELGTWYVLHDPVGEPDWQSGFKTSKGVKKPAWAMYQRPISRSVTRVKKKGRVRIWGKSNVSSSTAQIQWSKNGRTGWVRVPRQHRKTDKTMYVNVGLTSARFFRVKDSKGVGPIRKVSVR
jgi:hypothetical protein